MKTGIYRRLVFATVFPLVWWISGTLGYAEGGLTAERYCQLTVELLSNSVQEWENKISLLNEHALNKELFLEKEAEVTAEFSAKRDKLFLTYETNVNEYYAFQGENKGEIAAYLDSNSETKHNLDELTFQAALSVDQYEALLVTTGIRGDRIPQPVIQFQETVYNFGIVPEGQDVTQIFTFENAGDGVLKIEDVQVFGGSASALSYPEFVLSDQRGMIEVTFTATEVGSQTRTLYVYSNDPDRYSVELRVQWTVED